MKKEGLRKKRFTGGGSMATEVTLTYGEYRGIQLELEQLRAEVKAKDGLLADQFDEVRKLRAILAAGYRDRLPENLRGQRVPEPT
jgi:hypothetical protein